MPNQTSFDILVAGAGAAGIGAALGAAAEGASVLLVETEGTVGGDLVTGLPILGAWNSRGKQCVSGVLGDLLDELASVPGAVIGPVCDWRTVFGLCVCPAALQLAILALLRRRRVVLQLKSTVMRVSFRKKNITAVGVCTQHGSRTFSCGAVVDATGSGRLVELTGGTLLAPERGRRPQPVGLVFRMSGVVFDRFLAFVRDNPDEVLLAENPVFGVTRTEAAQRLYEGGLPYTALSAQGALLGAAVARGEVQPCTAFFTTPTSVARGEVCINATRTAIIGDDPFYILPELADQVTRSVTFLRSRVPGFEQASPASVGHRVGVRETTRVLGEEVLTGKAVLEGQKRPDGIAKGTHHVDLHGGGVDQVRKPIKDGRSYDIPFACLIPKKLGNVLVAGRCLSSDREANGSARVMGTCLATGQAAGVAATLLAGASGSRDARSIDVADLRCRLTEQGAILDGVQ